MKTKKEIWDRILDLEKTRIGYHKNANETKGDARKAWTHFAFELEPIICNLLWTIEESADAFFSDSEIENRMQTNDKGGNGK